MPQPDSMAAGGESRLALKRLREQRLHWFELPADAVGEPGLAVRFRRPLEAEMHRFVAGVTVEHVCEYVTEWRGFSEATLLGAAVGASDAIEFDRELWAEWVRDKSDVCAAVAKALAQTMQQHLEARQAAAKN